MLGGLWGNSCRRASHDLLEQSSIQGPGLGSLKSVTCLDIMAYMPMFLSVVITFPEFVAMLSVRESSSSPALTSRLYGVFSILDFSPLEVAPTLSSDRACRHG